MISFEEFKIMIKDLGIVNKFSMNKIWLIHLYRDGLCSNVAYRFKYSNFEWFIYSTFDKDCNKS